MRAKFGIALATAAMMASGVAAAQDLRIAPAAPPAHPAYNMYEVLRDGLAEESGGQLKATILGPEVVSLPQMSDALKSGLVDIGNYLPLYFPAEMANFNVGAGFGLTGRDQFVMSMAMTEWAVNCAACQDDFKKAGLVYTSSGSTDVYILLTTKPVRTADDIKGLRLRSGGAPFARWMEHFGATPVSMSVGEQFEGLSQKTIDGTVGTIFDLVSYRLVDVITHVTEIPVGTFHAGSGTTVTLPVWQKFTPQQREQALRAINRANLHLLKRWASQLPPAAREAAAKGGVEMLQPSPEFLAASDAFAREDAQALVAKHGEAATTFLALVEKWTKIVRDVGVEGDALEKTAWDEIYSKIDVNTYGL